jgi:hypothetical protein
MIIVYSRRKLLSQGILVTSAVLLRPGDTLCPIRAIIGSGNMVPSIAASWQSLIAMGSLQRDLWQLLLGSKGITLLIPYVTSLQRDVFELTSAGGAERFVLGGNGKVTVFDKRKKRISGIGLIIDSFCSVSVKDNDTVIDMVISKKEPT